MTPTDLVRATAFAVAFERRMALHGAPTSSVDAAGELVINAVDARAEATRYALMIAVLAVEGWER